MLNQSSGSCPYCGTQLVGGQPFCSNCGATAIVGNDQQTTMSHGDANIYPQPGSASAFDPYRPSQPYVEPVPYAQAYQPTAGNNQNSVPEYARPQDSSRSVLAQIGCGLVVMILLILSLCIGGGILAVRWISTLPAVTTPTESTPINYLHSSTHTFSQMHDPSEISRLITSTIDAAEIASTQINLSTSGRQQTISSPKIVQAVQKSDTYIYSTILPFLLSPLIPSGT